MSDRLLAAVLLSLVISLTGCNEEQIGGPRTGVVPITGKVLVDGKPVKDIAVLFLRTSEKGVDFSVPEPEAITDENGVLTVGTYVSDDGGPPGEYKLCFLWLRMDKFTGQMTGDNFKGKYGNKERSKFKVTVPEEVGDEPFDIGTIELTTK